MWKPLMHSDSKEMVLISIYGLCDLVPSPQGSPLIGGSCAARTRGGCLQPDSLACRIAKVSAKDGNGWSTL